MTIWLYIFSLYLIFAKSGEVTYLAPKGILTPAYQLSQLPIALHIVQFCYFPPH